ncbi:MAG: hemerythrin domain-containing protein, partial [Myxococcota bacterium]
VNIYQLLEKDHDTVRKLLEQIEKASTHARKPRETLFSTLRSELLAHLQAEQEVFYGALLQRLDDQDLLLAAFEEHPLVAQLIKDVESCAAEEQRWKDKLVGLKDLVEHHVEQGEGEIFEMAREHLAEEEEEELGVRMQERKEEILMLQRGSDALR